MAAVVCFVRKTTRSKQLLENALFSVLISPLYEKYTKAGQQAINTLDTTSTTCTPCSRRFKAVKLNMCSRYILHGLAAFGVVDLVVKSKTSSDESFFQRNCGTEVKHTTSIWRIPRRSVSPGSVTKEGR